VFFDTGVTVMTDLFFADQPMDQLKIRVPSGPVSIEALEIKRLPSI
jgi:hypothetical protein